MNTIIPLKLPFTWLYFAFADKPNLIDMNQQIDPKIRALGIGVRQWGTRVRKPRRRDSSARPEECAAWNGRFLL
jgi:hypothetical protein